MSKDGRFYLRLSSEERAMFDEVSERLGFADTSSAIRFLLREKHRELFGAEKPDRRPKPRGRR